MLPFGPISLMTSCAEKHQAERAQLGLQTFARQIASVCAEAVGHTRIPKRSGVDRLLARFSPTAFSIENRIRPLAAVSERRDVISIEDAEDRQSEPAADSVSTPAAATFRASASLSQLP
jgi:hypothetical protein